MTPGNRYREAVALGLLVVSLVGVLGSTSCEGRSEVYGLTADSQLETGCFAPLDCPVLLADGLGGTFRLSEAPFAAPSLSDTFIVSDVYWLARLGGEDVPITGWGTYTRSIGLPATHRLQLRLRVGDQEAEFDSALVGASSEIPDIDIRISIHGERLFDTVIDVRAVPFHAEAGGPRS